MKIRNKLRAAVRTGLPRPAKWWASCGRTPARGPPRTRQRAVNTADRLDLLLFFLPTDGADQDASAEIAVPLPSFTAPTTPAAPLSPAAAIRLRPGEPDPPCHLSWPGPLNADFAQS